MSLARWKLSLSFRLLSLFAAGSMLAGPLEGVAVALAAPRPSPKIGLEEEAEPEPAPPKSTASALASRQAGPAAPNVVPAPVLPAHVELVGDPGAPEGERSSAWHLWDGRGDTNTAVRPGEPMRVRAVFAEPTSLDEVTLRGSLRGKVSIVAEQGSELLAMGEAAEVRPATTKSEWVRFRIRSPHAVSAVVVQLEADVPGAVSEIGFWALRPPSPTSGDHELADRIMAGSAVGSLQLRGLPDAATIAKGASESVFEVPMTIAPSALSRAFLVYELRGLGHFTEVERAINGLRPRGGNASQPGQRAELAEGGLQVEEISPNWLQQGKNVVRFVPNAGGKYEVRHLRLVGLPHGQVFAPIGNEGLRPTPGPGGMVDFGQVVQPHELVLRVHEGARGRVVVRSAEKASSSYEIGLKGLAPGWHRFELDRKLGPSEGLGIALLGASGARPADGGAPVSGIFVSGSDLTPAPAPELGVSYPLHGECNGHEGRVRGFLSVPAGDSVSDWRVDGAVSDSMAADGSFEVTVPDQGSDHPWNIGLEARLTSGRVLRRAVRMNACWSGLDPSVSSESLREDEGAPFAALVHAGEARTLTFAGARLDIPAGAVEEDVRITIRPLLHDQVAPMGNAMINVTPDGRAYRFGPHGLTFKKPVRITLPFEPAALPDGMRERDVFGFYYDVPQQRWIHVGRFGMTGQGALASLTEHFTDFINATIAMPDQPGAKSFNANDMQGIKLADPTAGIDLVQPPAPNHTGTAGMSYPIEVPPGRHGIEPSLAFTYDSARTRGWLGTGWDLGLSRVEVDTRFGVPKYDGTETYLLDGQPLAPTTTQNPTATKEYVRRIEGRFDKIERIVAGTDVRWVVTDKNGTKFIYGETPGARLGDPCFETSPPASCPTLAAPLFPHVAQWWLERVVDTFGNQMAVTYFTDTGNNGDEFRQIYPIAIDYTSHPTAPVVSAAYRVRLALDCPAGSPPNGLAAEFCVSSQSTNTTPRPDVGLDGRLGFQVATRYRLDHADVLMGSTIIRRYQLNYVEGDFRKSLLKSLAMYGKAASVKFEEQTFDYFSTADGTGGTAAFEAPKQWGQVQTASGTGRTGDGLSRSDDTSGGVSGSVGVGLIPDFLDISVGGGGHWGSDRQKLTLLDVNGDGLPDWLDNGGRGTMNFLHPEQYLGGSPPPDNDHLRFLQIGGTQWLGHTGRSGWSVEGGINVAIFQGSLGYTRMSNDDDQIVADLNGDGFPDLVQAEDGQIEVALNDGTNHFKSLQTSQATLAVKGVKRSDGDFEADAASNGLRRIDPLTRWTAPWTGTVTVSGGIRKLKAGGNGVVASIVQNNGSFSWSSVVDDAFLNQDCVPSGTADCTGPGITLTVQAGDRLYFRVDSNHDGSDISNETKNDEVRWSPNIEYAVQDPTVLDFLEPYGSKIYRFSQTDDLRLAGRPQVSWTASAQGIVSFSGEICSAGTAFDICKLSTSDKVTVKVTKNSGGVVTQLFAHDLGADDDNTTLSIPPEPVNVGDTILFEYLTRVPIDPSRIKWNPSVRYTNYCRNDPQSHSNVCGDVSCQPDPNGNLTCNIGPQDPFPDIPISINAIVQSPEIYLPFVQWTSVGTAGPSHPFIVPGVPGSGPRTVHVAMSASAAAGSTGLAMIQGVHKLYLEAPLTTTGRFTGVSLAGDITVSPGDELFFTIYGSGPMTTTSAVVDMDAAIVDVKVVDESFEATIPPNPNLPRVPADPMSGGFHRWFTGFYNGELPTFDEQQIVFPFKPDGSLKNDPPSFNFAMPVRKGVPNVTGAAWVGPGAAAYIAPGQMKPGRTGLTGATGKGPNGGSLESLRSASGWNFEYGLSVGYGGFGLGAGGNRGRTSTNLDFFDFNGDRYPDSVSLEGVQFNNGDGTFGGRKAIPNMSTDALRRVENRSARGSVGGNVKLINQSATDAHPKRHLMTGFHVGYDYGLSFAQIDWIDMNGDGLPDLVRRNKDIGSAFTVQLNYGYRMSAPITWATSAWQSDPLGGGANLVAAATSILDFFQSEVSRDAIKIEDSGSDSGGFGLSGASGGVGGGASAGVVYNAQRTVVDLVDVNGDGLPDQVMKSPGSIRVRLNTGTRFDTSETVWNLPNWEQTVDSGFDEDVGYIAVPQLNDALDYRRSKAYNVGINFKVCYLFICVGVSAYYSDAKSAAYSGFRDVDGDGRVDQVFKPLNASQAYVKLNKVTKSNLLSTVHRPLLGTIHLDYGRSGNLVRRDISPKIDSPTNDWVLTNVTVDDGRGNSYPESVSYTPSRLYDRDEREDLGFAQMTQTHEDGSLVETTFERHGCADPNALGCQNQAQSRNYYLRGMATRSVLRDSAGKVFTKQDFTHNLPTSPAGAVCRQDPTPCTFFPSESDRSTTYFEGLTTNPDDPNATKKSTAEHRTWDTNGDLLTFTVDGEPGRTDDDLTYAIDYQRNASLHFSHPKSIIAKHCANPPGCSSFTTLRKRTATYDDATGALHTVSNIVLGGIDPTTGAAYVDNPATNPTWTFDHGDGFGNVTLVTDPNNFTLAYEYDSTTHTHRTKTTDKFGYISSATTDLSFGLPALETDINGHMTLIQYDDFGRVSKVFAPAEVGTTHATVAMTYSLPIVVPTASQPAYARTDHFDSQHPSDPVTTVTFADGLGRMIETKKDLAKDTGSGTTPTPGMTVSGKIGFDVRGRIVSRDQPVFDTGSATSFVDLAPGRATKFTYDVLDRVTSIMGPDGATATTRYGIDTIGTASYLSTTVQDANFNDPPTHNAGKPGLKTSTYKTVLGNAELVREFNRLTPSQTNPVVIDTRYGYDSVQQLLSVTDAKNNVTTAQYDTLGRIVSLTNPDMGTTTWRYDHAGNLAAKQTARLAAQSKTVKYVYEFDRLKKIDYPDTVDTVYTYGDPKESGDLVGNVASRIKTETSDGGTVTYRYDPLGNIAQEHWALTRLQQPWYPAYDATVSYDYDSFSRLLGVHFPSPVAEVVNYTYDAGGSVTTVTGHVSGKPDNSYLKYVGYNEFGTKDRQIYGNGIEAKYVYDPLTRRLKEVNAKQRDPNLIYFNKPARQFESMRYSYDLSGNLSQIRNDAPFDDSNQSFVLTGLVTQNFTYDDLYQLKSADGTCQEHGSSRLKYSLGFSYNEIGNILTKSLGTDYQIPDQSHPGQWVKYYSIHDATYQQTYTYGGPRPHAPTKVDEHIDQNTYTDHRVFQYDPSGNQSSSTDDAVGQQQNRVVEWDEDDRLHRVTLNGVELARASYDGSGERAVNLQVPAAGTVAYYETAYFGPNLTLRNASFLTKHIFVGNERIASKMDTSYLGPVPTIIYFHADHLGGTNFLTNDVQELVAHEEYFPTGELWVDEFDRRYPLRQEGYLFNGKELDAATGLYYYGARYYDPQLSLWASPDPILKQYMGGQPNAGVFKPGNLGLYSYSYNDPVSKKDPTGLVAGVDDAAEVVLGAAAFAAVTLYVYSQQPANRRSMAMAMDATWSRLQSWASSLRNPSPGPRGPQCGRCTGPAPQGGGGSPPPIPPGAAAAGTGAVVAASQNPTVQNAVAHAGEVIEETEGAWVEAAEHMSARAAAYQQQIGGRIGQVFLKAGVKFDAFVNGILRDGKGPGYARFVKDGVFRVWFQGKDALLDQARRQLAAAGGTPIEWRVAEQKAADAIRALFASNGIHGISIVVEPAVKQ
jgi:RHS repeat-associated protein